MSPKLYIRFGELPIGGHSHNFKDNTQEMGVSVYDCTIVEGQPRIVLPPLTDNTLDTLKSLFHFQKRPIYLVLGIRVSTGSDGEPLIIEAKVLDDITLLLQGTP